MEAHDIYTPTDWHAFYRNVVEAAIRENDIDANPPHIYLLERDGEFERLDPRELVLAVQSGLAGPEEIAQSLEGCGYRSFAFVVPTWRSRGWSAVSVSRTRSDARSSSS